MQTGEIGDPYGQTPRNEPAHDVKVHHGGEQGLYSYAAPSGHRYPQDGQEQEVVSERGENESVGVNVGDMPDIVALLSAHTHTQHNQGGCPEGQLVS